MEALKGLSCGEAGDDAVSEAVQRVVLSVREEVSQWSGIDCSPGAGVEGGTKVMRAPDPLNFWSKRQQHA